jgi:S1-C subfamily serine protease
MNDKELENSNMNPPGLNESTEVIQPDLSRRHRLRIKTVALIRSIAKAAYKLLLKFNPAISVMALIIGSVALYFGIGPYLHFKNTNPNADGYVPPRSIQTLVDNVQASTVTVFCDYAKDDYVMGTGWAIPRSRINKVSLETTIITNHHVIEDCVKLNKPINIKLLGGKEFKASIGILDKKNDLATLNTKAKIDPLSLSNWAPFPGYWVMAVGTADGFEGSIAFGNVLNTDDLDVLITAPISHGNSGGPLVDNEGNVIGINTWSSTKEQYNGAVSLDALCEAVLKCKGKYFWPRQD